MRRIETLLDITLDAFSDALTIAARTRAAFGRDEPREREGGGRARAALNGMWGDRLDRRAHPWAEKMGFRHLGERSETEPELCSRPRAAVFVHGWSGTEAVWMPPAADGPSPTFGDRLREDLGYAPLYVRYNTGRHVSENGRSLCALLEDLRVRHPLLEELVLIGHSMGGLVVRSAAQHAAESNAGWVRLLSHVFCLGSPHLGSMLEQGAHVLASALGSVDHPVVRAWTDMLNTRSSGIKDLRFGYTRDEEWQGKDPDAFFEDGRVETQLVPGVGYHFAAATLTRAPEGPFGRLVGDIFVRTASATGHASQPTRRVLFRSGQVLGGLDHYALARHPAVYEILRLTLSPDAPPALAAPCPP